MNQHRRWGALAAVTSLALVLSACGGGSSSSDDVAADDGASPGAAGTDAAPTKLRVTTLPLCEEIGLYTQDGGFFEEHGIEAEFVKAAGGNAGVATLQAGAADVAFITATAVIGAMQAGVDLTIISGAVRTSEGSNGVIVKEDSEIQGPEDLAGEKVGVLELAGSGATSISNWVKDATNGKGEPQFVQFPFPELVPAVLNGTVAAAQVTASEIFALEKDGTGRSIGNPGYEVAGGSTPTGMYVVATDYLKKNEETLKGFVAAMQEAADQANDPADTEHFDVLSKYCKKPAADLAQIPAENRSVFEGYVDREAFDRLVTVLRKVGSVKDGFEPADHVADFAWKQ